MSAKYFKRGTREYYQVTPERVIRIMNKLAASYITISHSDTGAGFALAGEARSLILEDALEGTEITREEFAKEFKEASRLIVLEP